MVDLALHAGHAGDRAADEVPHILRHVMCNRIGNIGRNAFVQVLDGASYRTPHRRDHPRRRRKWGSGWRRPHGLEGVREGGEQRLADVPDGAEDVVTHPTRQAPDFRQQPAVAFRLRHLEANETGNAGIGHEHERRGHLRGRPSDGSPLAAAAFGVLYERDQLLE